MQLSLSRVNILAWQKGPRLQVLGEGEKEGRRRERDVELCFGAKVRYSTRLSKGQQTYIGAFRLILTYIKNPWFVILCHSESERDCEAGKVSFVVIRRKFINDFSPRKFRPDRI